MPDPVVPSEKLRQALHGVPEDTIQACAEFQATRNDAAFDRALCGLVEHYLPRKPAQPVASLPGSTNLVTDLQVDSLAMVELAFVFEDIFATKLPQEDLVKVVTLDDLRALLRREMKLPPAPAA